MSYRFCQNWRISQVEPDERGEGVLPREVVEMAKKNDCEGIAYTYTEPTVFYEYAFDIAETAEEEGLSNYFITNNYIKEEPLKEITPLLDAVNVDLKSFDPEFYKELIEGADMGAVKDAIKLYYENDVWVEITNLVIPRHNDDMDSIREMAAWIVEELDENVPLHLSRFFPSYKMSDVRTTDLETLKKAKEVVEEEGLNYVYIGNVREAELSNTYCNNCGELVIRRSGLKMNSDKLEDGNCPNCGTEIPGIF